MTRARARSRIEQLVKDYHALSPEKRSEMSEADVVQHFVTPLLDALGWPVHDPNRFLKELSTVVGKPDITLVPERGGTIFVEAKRFHKIKELQEARKTIAGTITPGQLALPGMAADRTQEEQQAITYAFANNGTWAILANFEKLRLFNARRDWLVLSFERPGAFLDDFDLLWQLSYEQILAGGLDALSNQRVRAEVDEEYLQFINLWRQRLAQDIVEHTDVNPWVFRDDGTIDLHLLRSIVQRILDRLVVVRYAEDHLVLPAGTLQGIYELHRDNPYTPPLNSSYQHLFRKFDDLHNSGLFARGPADDVVISDDVLGGLTERLYAARYRAMSADIMGNTYEQFLGKTLQVVGGSVITTDNLETRKKQGSYYTPPVIVEFLVDNSLGRYLYGTFNGKPDGELLEGETRKTSAEIRSLRLIDPACGSGSFLIYAYKVLADFYRAEIARLEHERSLRYAELVAQGMTKPFDLQVELTPYTAELDRLQNYPTWILENHIYGVDLDPQAAEIATVNLIMRAMADMPHSHKRLPLILNQNIKVGNSLIGAAPADPRYADHAGTLAAVRRLRIQLAQEGDNDPHDGALAQVDALSDEVRAALDADLDRFFAVPATQRPFSWGMEFPEVFLNEDGRIADNGGFDVVVGNPPWEIVKPDLREYYAQFDSNIESKLKGAALQDRIKEINRVNPDVLANWLQQEKRLGEQGAYFGDSGEYELQGGGDTATHKLFLERCFKIASNIGLLALIVPAGIYADVASDQLRRKYLSESHIHWMLNFSNERFFFPGVHHGTKFTLLSCIKGSVTEGFWTCFRINPRVAISSIQFNEFVSKTSNLVWMDVSRLKTFDPKHLTVMEVKHSRDISILDSLYSFFPRLGEHDSQAWQPEFGQELHMSGDSDIFETQVSDLPLFEGKMIHSYNTAFRQPQYWVNKEAGFERIAKTKAKTWPSQYRLVFREVSGAENERTAIAAVLYPGTITGHTLWSVLLQDHNTMLFLTAIINSYCCDWLLRMKVSQHVTLAIMKQLPVPRLNAGDRHFDAIVPRAARLTCTTSVFAELWQEVMGEAWDGSKGATDAVQRQQIRDEIDVIVAHLYGLSRADFAHILGTFPLVFPDDAQGKAKMAAMLALFDSLAPEFAATPLS